MRVFYVPSQLSNSNCEEPKFGKIETVNFYNDVKWYVPKMKNGQLLSVPVTTGKEPLCAFFVKDISRQCEVIDFGKLL